jgi:hypothetical protein
LVVDEITDDALDSIGTGPEGNRFVSQGSRLYMAAGGHLRFARIGFATMWSIAPCGSRIRIVRIVEMYTCSMSLVSAPGCKTRRRSLQSGTVYQESFDTEETGKTYASIRALTSSNLLPVLCMSIWIA